MAAAIGTPGYQAWNTAATAAAVATTNPTARRAIGPQFSANCRHDVRRAAAYSSGGSTSGRIRSGGMWIFGANGISATTHPNTVIRIADATPIRRDSGSARIAANSSTNISTNWSMTIQSACPHPATPRAAPPIPEFGWSGSRLRQWRGRPMEAMPWLRGSRIGTRCHQVTQRQSHSRGP